jgi:FtsH-binding integral membrane protein
MNREYAQTFTASQVMSRNLMRNVYIWMALGLAITGVVAWGSSRSAELMNALYRNNGFFILLIAEVGLVFFLSARIMKIKPMTATLLFAAYSALNGLTMSYIFLVYARSTVSSAFFIAAGMFGAMTLFAFFTKSDLSGWGTYLFMGVIGLIIASVVNMLLRSDGLSYIISYAGVLIFMGLTAFDTQRIKRMSDALSEDLGEPDYIRLSIIGALRLYLDFINIFLFMLRIFGGGRK